MSLRWFVGCGAICVQIALVPAAMAQPIDVAADCRSAADVAEREAGLPPGLLLAIGQVESGRVDPLTGRRDPWPWTTNLRGAGHFFGSAQEAITWVAEQQAVGNRPIDVGCFQVDLQFHPTAFANLTQAFEPASNARYAARFLNELHARTGSWPQAVALYHSADPTLGMVYRSQVFAAWGGGGAPFDRPGGPTLAFVDRVAVRLSAQAAAVRIVVPNWAAASGRFPAAARQPGLPPVFTPSR